MGFFWRDECDLVQDNPTKYEKSRGSTFCISFSTEPGNHPSGIHISNIAQQDTEEGNVVVRQ
jgi:hypothetical protein